jgi:hypothetical protein
MNKSGFGGLQAENFQQRSNRLGERSFQNTKKEVFAAKLAVRVK